jgi:hypothetical protein
MRETIEVRRATLGPIHPSTLASVSNLAQLLKAQGKLGEAEPLMREALAYLTTLSPKHPNTLSTMSSLAALLQAQGNLGESQALLKKTLEDLHATLGPQHPYSLTVERMLAQVSEALYKSSVQDFPLYPTHPKSKGGGKRK